MRILHLLAPAPAGGLERVVQGLAIGQLRRGHTVTVVAVVEQWHDDQPFAQPLARAGVTVVPVVAGARDYLGERRMLRSLMAQHRPDVVQSHGYHTNVVGRSAIMDVGVPFVATAHGFTGGSLKNRVYEWLDCRALARSDAAIAVSRPLTEELVRRGVPSPRVHAVPNGWIQSVIPLDRHEARSSLGLSPDAPIAGWVGRMTQEKGLDVFIRSLAYVPEDVRACIIGNGVERTAGERLAAELGVANRITWAGLVSEAGRYFKAFNVLCQSSRTEGIPMAILEAMALQVPVVATAVGGVPDVLSANEAHLVASEDSAALGGAITDAIEHGEQAQERAHAAYRRLNSQFSGDQWMDEHERIYRLAISQHRSHVG